MSSDDESPQDRDAKSPSTKKPAVQQWTAEHLLAEANEARIVLGNEVYRLLLTRNHKLILVK